MARSADESSSDDLNDSEDDSSSSGSDSDGDSAKGPRGPFQKITPEASWDDQGDRPAIMSPSPRAMRMRQRVGKVREDRTRRYSISSYTKWEDDHGAAEESHDYFNKLQQELTRKNEKSRRSIIRRRMSMVQGISAKKPRKKKQGRSASITNTQRRQMVRGNSVPPKQLVIDDDPDDLPRLPFDRDAVKQELIHGMPGSAPPDRNGHALQTPVVDGGAKRLSTSELWAKEDGGIGDDDMDEDLDAYTRKRHHPRKSAPPKSRPKPHQKRVSSVTFADNAFIHNYSKSPRADGDAARPAMHHDDDDSSVSDVDLGGSRSRGSSVSGGGSVIVHDAKPSGHRSGASSGGGSVIVHGTKPSGASNSRSDGSSSEDTTDSTSSSSSDHSGDSAQNAGPADDDAVNPSNSSNPSNPSNIANPSNPSHPTGSGPSSSGKASQGIDARPSVSAKRPKRRDKERRPSDRIKSVLDDIAPDDMDSDDEVNQSVRPKSGKHSRAKRKDKERRPSDKIKNVLDDIAPDDSDSSEDEEEQRARQKAFDRRRSMPRRKSKKDIMKEMIESVDHNSMDNVLDDELLQKRPSRKDKERRPSDKVKDLLNDIAPDVSSSEDDEEMDHRRKREQMEAAQRASGRVKRKDKMRRTSDQVKSVLDDIAPDESDSSDDEVERRIRAIEKRKSMKKRQSNVDQMNAMLDDLANSDGGDSDGDKENAKPPPTNAMGRGGRSRARSDADKIMDVLNAVDVNDDMDDSMEILDPSPTKPSGILTKEASQPNVIQNSTSSPALSDDGLGTPITNTATPITNAMMDAKDGSDDERGHRSDYSGSDYSDIEEKMKMHRKRKSEHYKQMGRESELSDDDDFKVSDEEKRRAGQRQRKKTLDKLFTNYALKDGDEPPTSPDIPPSVDHHSSNRGRKGRNGPSSRNKPSTASSNSKKRRTSPNPSKRVSVKGGRTPLSSQKRPRSKGRKSVKAQATNSRGNGRKKVANGSRANPKKKVAAKKKGKKKGGRKVQSPESVDSDEEREDLWEQMRNGNSMGNSKRRRQRVQMSDSDSGDALTDDSNGSGF